MMLMLSSLYNLLTVLDLRLELRSNTAGKDAHLPGCAQETRTYWFNPSSLEDEDEFMLVGLVLGLAIYNAVLLDFPLPLALYRKLIGQSCTLRDLQDMEPTLGKSLTALLQFEGLPGLPDSASEPWCSLLFLTCRVGRLHSAGWSQQQLTSLHAWHM